MHLPNSGLSGLIAVMKSTKSLRDWVWVFTDPFFCLWKKFIAGPSSWNVLFIPFSIYIGATKYGGGSISGASSVFSGRLSGKISEAVSHPGGLSSVSGIPFKGAFHTASISVLYPSFLVILPTWSCKDNKILLYSMNLLSISGRPPPPFPIQLSPYESKLFKVLVRILIN